MNSIKDIFHSQTFLISIVFTLIFCSDVSPAQMMMDVQTVHVKEKGITSEVQYFIEQDGGGIQLRLSLKPVKGRGRENYEARDVQLKLGEKWLIPGGLDIDSEGSPTGSGSSGGITPDVHIGKSEKESIPGSGAPAERPHRRLLRLPQHPQAKQGNPGQWGSRLIWVLYSARKSLPQSALPKGPSMSRAAGAGLNRRCCVMCWSIRTNRAGILPSIKRWMLRYLRPCPAIRKRSRNRPFRSRGGARSGRFQTAKALRSRQETVRSGNTKERQAGPRMRRASGQSGTPD